MRASSLPMLAQSPCFKSEGSDFADAGTARHKAFESALRGDNSLLEKLPEEEIENVRWAVDYVKLKAPLSDAPLELELKDTLVLDDFSELTGTMDAVCGLEIFDLKWRARDYTLQMAAYGEMRKETLNVSRVRVHLLFAEQMRVNVFWVDDFRETLNAMIARARTQRDLFTPGDYCGWCSRRVGCPAMTSKAQEVALGYADDKTKVQSWHPSELTDPAQVAAGLTIWRTLLKPWGASMEYHAKELAEKEELPGFKWQEKAGRKFCADVQRAFELSGLSAAEFLAACDLRLNTSKKYPDRRGLFNIVAEKEKTPLARAKKDLLKKLQEVVLPGKPTRSLVAVKGETETESED